MQRTADSSWGRISCLGGWAVAKSESLLHNQEKDKRTWCETNTVRGPTSAKNPIYSWSLSVYISTRRHPKLQTRRLNHRDSPCWRCWRHHQPPRPWTAWTQLRGIAWWIRPARFPWALYHARCRERRRQRWCSRTAQNRCLRRLSRALTLGIAASVGRSRTDEGEWCA